MSFGDRGTRQVSLPLLPVAGSPVALDASSSHDDGSIARYEWDLDGDGTFETDTQATPGAQTTFGQPGPATVRLRVTDNDGVAGTTQLTFQVVSPEAAQDVAPDTTAPRMAPLSRVLRATPRGPTHVRLRCPVTEQRCTVRIQVVGLQAPLSGKRLGARTINMPGGRTMSVPVQLTTGATQRVRRGTLRARAIITATDQSGNRAITRTAVTIRR
jgi:hypothetical protein